MGHVPDKLVDETGFPVNSEGEVEMHNSTYQQTRFPFTYCWWGAFNWKRKCKDNLDICGEKPLRASPCIGRIWASVRTQPQRCLIANPRYTCTSLPCVWCPLTQPRALAVAMPPTSLTPHLPL